MRDAPSAEQFAAASVEIDDDEIHELLVRFEGAKREIDAALREIEEGRCPIFRLPRDQCARCLSGDPRHFPGGLTTRVREIFGGLGDQALRFLRELMQE